MNGCICYSAANLKPQYSFKIQYLESLELLLLTFILKPGNPTIRNLHARYQTTLFYLSSASSNFDWWGKFIYNTPYIYKYRHILVLKHVFYSIFSTFYFVSFIHSSLSKRQEHLLSP